jgi:hypothetical protein
MAKRPRSNITFSDRVGAAVSATHIAHMFRDEQASHAALPWRIVALLEHNTVVDRAEMRRLLDKLLELELGSSWRTAWLQLHVGEIELAIGVGHDPRSLAAHTAWHSGTRDAFDNYARSLKPGAAIDSAIPTKPAVQDA